MPASFNRLVFVEYEALSRTSGTLSLTNDTQVDQNELYCPALGARLGLDGSLGFVANELEQCFQATIRVVALICGESTRNARCVTIASLVAIYAFPFILTKDCNRFRIDPAKTKDLSCHTTGVCVSFATRIVLAITALVPELIGYRLNLLLAGRTHWSLSGIKRQSRWRKS